MHQLFRIRQNRPKSDYKTIVAIGLLFLLIVSATFTTFLPTVNAADVNTYAYLSVTPNPVGVDQPVSIIMWLDKAPPVDSQNRALTFSNYTLEITKPDGSKQTMGPYQSDYIASKYLAYTPDAVGTYRFQFKYLGETLNNIRHSSGAAINNYTYIPSTSREMTLTVQATPISTQYPEAALPTGYWQRPIHEENREWYTLGGNWLGLPLLFGTGYDAIGCFNPYTTAPNTAHIVWTKPHIFGGITGGEFDTRSYYTGLSYEEKWNPPTVVVIAGRMYYHLPLSNWPTGGGLACVDLRTGEQIWWKNITINFGQLLNFDSMNQHGVIPYLWRTGSTYTMYDAVSGEAILTMANATNGKAIYDDNGNLLVYIMNGQRNWLAMWNSTKVEGLITLTGADTGYQWRPPVGRTLDWRTGIQWNITIPEISGQALTLVSKDILISTKPYVNENPPLNQLTGYNAKTGEYLWAFNISEYAMVSRSNYLFGPIVDGVFTYFDQAKTVWYGYNAYTGEQIWGPTEPYDNPWGVYSQSYRGAGQNFVQVGYGKLYTTGYDGTVRCFDIQTGENLWNFFTGTSGYETVYGNYPMYGGVTIADNKVYISSNEHSPNSPNWRGGKMYCIDAHNGTLIWSVSGWMPGPIIADGYLAVLNSYDGQIYSFGKGLSKTTISTPDTAIPQGTPVLIKGTITDQSPGQTCLGIPAAGTPAISDESMSAWMEYLYMQKPQPTNATGVPIQITVTDQNNITSTITTTTSTANGKFSILWTAPDEGKYTITATFLGSNSYYASHDSSALAISATSPQPTSTTTSTPSINPTQTLPTTTSLPTSSPTVAPEPDSTTQTETLLIAAAATIILIVVMTALLVLKKRK
jgi:outer membrane protein assembly factor BamB